FNSFLSCLVNFPPGEIEGTEAAFGIGIDVTDGDGDGELIGSILGGLNFCAWDLNFPRVASVCDAPVVGLSDADSAGMAPEETVSLAAGEADAADLGVALGIVRGAGVGKGDAEDTGVEVAAGVGDGSDG